MKIKTSSFLSSLLVLFILQSSLVPLAAASNAVIDILPNSGTYNIGEQFPVQVIIDGMGEKFNAAESAIEISSLFQISDLVLGDCNFSYIQTPSISNPSFIGVILGSYSYKCTAYTMKLTALAPGLGTIKQTKASIKSQGDAHEILSLARSGIYNINNSVKKNKKNNFVNNSESTSNSTSELNTLMDKYTSEAMLSGKTTVALKITDANNNPISDAKITVNQPDNSASPQEEQKSNNAEFASTDKNGLVVANIYPGVYGIKIEKDGNVIAEQILQVPDGQKSMVLGIQQQKSIEDNTLIIIALGVITLLIIVIIFFRNSFLNTFIKFRQSKKN